MSFEDLFDSLKDVGFAVFGVLVIILIFGLPWMVGVITIFNWLAIK